jgi:phosphatidylethanolamine/phosphatidyl-N-methylethanolamine N-methyltransferase
LRDWYATHYSTVAASANGSRIQRYLHRRMEAPFTRDRTITSVLEVGGNKGEHVPFVCHPFERYVVSDLNEPVLLPQLVGDARIRTCQCDAAALPFKDASFDRVVSTCVLHHVEDPLEVVAEMRRVVRAGGWITLMIPTDPSLAYRSGVAVTSARAARRTHVLEEMRLVKAVDHRNHYRSIAAQVRYICRGDELRIEYFPTRIPTVEMNMFTVWQIRRQGAGA